MIINETTNINALITEKDSTGTDITVMNVAAYFDNINLNFNINCNVLNKTLLIANAADAQSQFNSVLDSIKQKMIDLQYPITIR